MDGQESIPGFGSPISISFAGIAATAGIETSRQNNIIRYFTISALINSVKALCRIPKTDLLHEENKLLIKIK